MDRNDGSGGNTWGNVGSPPARGAWIATRARSSNPTGCNGRLPRGGRGSQRGQDHQILPGATVASREGGVDRNSLLDLCPDRHRGVASREGGVDRNGITCPKVTDPPVVASREGGVDRNGITCPKVTDPPVVASREGGVDRNSPQRDYDDGLPVASREGGVDRNMGRPGNRKKSGGRLPRGGRGSQPGAVVVSDRDVGGRLPRGGRGSQLGWPHVVLLGLQVASREGGVDRNTKLTGFGERLAWSPPARGAWIATR